ncbi:hypothetical protein PIROE2DRAFT_13472 [Piromyces sp. E2]|nr:hypothetical protein PIROE2DRAFT_13472 [Piromyces sp. E2]|eukprot:OUM60698.1 hypothetical protein PIROE2DRAFT_13472 [Piromyces sp. E2]
MTDKTLNRRSTYGIKKAGSEAWKWLSAEDSFVSEDQPMGVSFYQRNDTYRQYRNGRTAPQYVNQSYFKNLSSSEQSYTSVDVEEPRETDEVRRQLREMKRHIPYFMIVVTVIQIFFLFFAIGKNYSVSGKLFASMDENPMIGPYPSTLISLGARFLPCMQRTNMTEIECPPGVKSNRYVTKNAYDQNGQIYQTLQRSQMCSVADICGFDMQEGETPDQWYRFIIPIFLHSGIIHLLFNLIFQIRTGVPMEKEFGSWRMIIIYMASGIFGFIFEAKSVGYAPSVGCSGALYGMYK